MTKAVAVTSNLPSPLVSAVTQQGDFRHSLSELLAKSPQYLEDVLIVHDHPEDPYKLLSGLGISLTGLSTMTIHEYSDMLTTMKPRKPQLIIMSFIHCEEKTNTWELSYSKNCLYSRHMDSNTVVICQLYMERSLGTRMMNFHTPTPRVLLAKYEYDLMVMPKSWIYFDGWTDRFLQTETAKDPQLKVWKSNWHNPPLVRLTVQGEFVPSCKQKITTLHIENYWSFSYNMALRKVTQVKVNLTKPCSTENIGIFGDYLNLPRVDNLCVEYAGPNIPKMESRSVPSKPIGRKNSNPRGAVFTLSEVGWNPNSPYREITVAELKSNLELWQKAPQKMPFIKHFGVLKLRGIGDEALRYADLSFVNTIHWERLIFNPKSEAWRSSVLNLCCPRLDSLTLSSAVNCTGQLIPTFEYPNLRSLKLVSLKGSNMNWNIKDLLQGYLPQGLREVELNGYWWRSDKENLPALTTSDLDFIRPVVQKLSVKGYLPNFVYSQAGKGAAFKALYPNLKEITIDVSRISLHKGSLGSSSKGYVLKVDFNTPSFPALQVVSLVVPYGGSKELIKKMKTLMLLVSPTCTRIEVSSTLLLGKKELEVNGEMVGQGITDDVLETKRTGRVWQRKVGGEFFFHGFKILEELEDSITYTGN